MHVVEARMKREIRYRFPGDGEPTSTGFDEFVDPHTGSPSPRSSFHLPLEEPATPFFVMYTDMRGRERGPFELSFDPEWERIRNGKRIIEETRHVWLRYLRDHLVDLIPARTSLGTDSRCFYDLCSNTLLCSSF